MFRSNLMIHKRRAISLIRLYSHPEKKEKCFVIKSQDQGKTIVYESQIIKQFQEKQLYQPKLDDELGLRKLALMSWEQILAITQPILRYCNLHKKSLMKSSKAPQAIVVFQKASAGSKMSEDIKGKIQNFASKDSVEKAKQISQQMVKKSYEQLIALIRQMNLQRNILEFQKTLKEKATAEEIKKLPEKLQEQWKTVQVSESYKTIVKVPERAIEMSKISVSRCGHHYRVFMNSEFKDQLVKTTINIVTWSWIKGKRIANKSYKFIYEAYFETPSRKNSKH